MQPLGRVGEQVAVLVNRAALGRHVAPERGQRLLQPAPTVNNQELWLAQPALDEIVEDGAPSLPTLFKTYAAELVGLSPDGRQLTWAHGDAGADAQDTDRFR
jgi:hypothetical protein